MPKNEVNEALSDSSVQTHSGQSSDVSHHASRCSELIDIVEMQIKCSHRQLVQSPFVVCLNNIQCIQQKMGNSSGSVYSSRPLGVSRRELAYTCFGIKSLLFGSQIFAPSHKGESCSGSDGKYNCYVLGQQARRCPCYALRQSVCGTGISFTMSVW